MVNVITVNIICDKCGQKIEKSDADTNKLSFKYSTDDTCYDTTTYDLCDECMKKLELWLDVQ